MTMGLKEFTKVMRALSDPNRVKILKMLQKRTLCVCEIQAALNISQPTVSKHLRVLEEAGLVDFTKNGKWIDYFLVTDSSNPYASYVLKLLNNWLEDDKEISKLIESLKEIDRRKIKGDN